MFTYLCNDIYENLLVKSVGLNLFRLLGSSSSTTTTTTYSSSRSVDASSFGCVVILSLCLALNFVISFITAGIFKSVYKTLLDKYHGAFTTARRTLF